MFRKPDGAGRIDVYLVNAVLGIRQDEVLLHSCARIQFHQTMGITAVGQPDITVVIETHVLACPVADESSRQFVIFRRIRTFARRIGGQVILDIHRFAELRFLEGHFLIDPHCTRLGIRPEVLDQIGKQVFTVLPRKT